VLLAIPHFVVCFLQDHSVAAGDPHNAIEGVAMGANVFARTVVSGIKDVYRKPKQAFKEHGIVSAAGAGIKGLVGVPLSVVAGALGAAGTVVAGVGNTGEAVQDLLDDENQAMAKVGRLRSPRAFVHSRALFSVAHSYCDARLLLRVVGGRNLTRAKPGGRKSSGTRRPSFAPQASTASMRKGSGAVDNSAWETKHLEVTVAIVDAGERLYDKEAKTQKRKHTSVVKTLGGRAVWREALLMQKVGADKELLLTVYDSGHGLMDKVTHASRKPLGSVRIPIPELYPLFRESHTHAASLDPFQREVAAEAERRRRLLAKLNRKFENKFAGGDGGDDRDSAGQGGAGKGVSFQESPGATSGGVTFEEPRDSVEEKEEEEMEMDIVDTQNQVGGEDEQLNVPTHFTARDRAKSTKYHIVWEPDDTATACAVCDEKFTMTRRRHHCRRCGKIVHDGCSLSRRKVFGSKNGKRVCDNCLAMPDDDEDEYDESFSRDRDDSMMSEMDAVEYAKPAYHPSLSPQHEAQDNTTEVMSSPSKSGGLLGRTTGTAATVEDAFSPPRKKTGVQFASSTLTDGGKEKSPTAAQWFPLKLELELPAGSGPDKFSMSDSIAQVKQKLEGLMGIPAAEARLCSPEAEVGSEEWWDDNHTLEACLEDEADKNPEFVRIDCQVGTREIQFSATLIAGRNEIPGSLMRM
jgi:hypothetical protein